MSIVCLGGGVGATRLWREIAPIVGANEVTVVVNTADDLWHYGLRVCPDIDTVIYGLAGKQDIVRGWGLADETFKTMEAVSELGVEPWFSLGDKDLATHLVRTQLLRDGLPLTDVTARLAAAQGVSSTILPMSDDHVVTELHNPELGWLPFQEFHVKHRAAVDVDAVRYTGIEQSRTPAAVLDAIENAQLIIIGPSSPVASVLPILAVGRTRAAIAAATIPVVAVTPVVNGVAFFNPGDEHRGRTRARLMKARGHEHRATEVARLYANVASHFVLDEADSDELEEIATLGLEPLVTSTLTHLPGSSSVQLIRAILAACKQPAAVDGAALAKGTGLGQTPSPGASASR